MRLPPNEKRRRLSEIDGPPLAPPPYILASEDGTVTVIEILAAALLFLGSALIIRAVMVSDLGDPTAASRHEGETTPDDLRRAA